MTVCHKEKKYYNSSLNSFLIIILIGKVMITTDDFELTNGSQSDCINFTTSSNNEVDDSMFQTLTLVMRDIPVRYALRETTVEVTDANGK